MIEILNADLRSQRRPLSSSADLAALQRFGCFLVTDALSATLLGDIHDDLKWLFGLPEQRKRAYRADKNQDPLAAGHSPYGRARALDTGIPNLLETWDINGVGEYWPQEFKDTLSAIEDLQSQLRAIAVASLSFLSNISGLEQLAEPSFQRKLSAGIHLIHYFPITSEHPVRAVRQSTHEDNTLVTLIPSADPADSPLLILDRETQSMVPVLPGTCGCIVQFGSALTALSHGKLPSCVHTIRDPRSSEEPNASRYSTPFFVAPGPTTELFAVAQDGSTRQVLYGETSNQYFKAIFGDEE